MTGCCAFGCNSRSEDGYLMKRLPTDPYTRSLWLDSINREGWEPTNRSCVCEIHFTEDQFESHRADGKRRLKPFATPTLFCYHRQSERQTPRKRGRPSLNSIEQRKRLKSVKKLYPTAQSTSCPFKFHHHSDSDVPVESDDETWEPNQQKHKTAPVISCSVSTCKEQSNQGSKQNAVTFHKFPLSDNFLRNTWLRSIGQPDLTPTKQTYICSKHFTDASFSHVNSRLKLKKAAVPTLFLNESPQNTNEQPLGDSGDAETEQPAVDDCYFTLDQLKLLDGVSRQLISSLHKLKRQTELHSQIEMSLIVKKHLYSGENDDGEDKPAGNKSSTLVFNIVASEANEGDSEYEEDGDAMDRDNTENYQASPVRSRYSQEPKALRSEKPKNIPAIRKTPGKRGRPRLKPLAVQLSQPQLKMSDKQLAKDYGLDIKDCSISLRREGLTESLLEQQYPEGPPGNRVKLPTTPIVQFTAGKSPTVSNQLVLPQDKFVCVLCKLFFTRRRTFLVHLAKHAKHSVCPLCNQKSGDIAKHMERHVDTRDGTIVQTSKTCFSCGVKVDGDYAEHVKEHGVDIAKFCTICDKLFSTVQLLDRHNDKFHSVPGFMCGPCVLIFATSQYMTTHLMENHNECTSCGRDFKTSSELSSHVSAGCSGTLREHDKFTSIFPRNILSMTPSKNRSVVIKEEECSSEEEDYSISYNRNWEENLHDNMSDIATVISDVSSQVNETTAPEEMEHLFSVGASSKDHPSQVGLFTDPSIVVKMENVAEDHAESSEVMDVDM